MACSCWRSDHAKLPQNEEATSAALDCHTSLPSAAQLRPMVCRSQLLSVWVTSCHRERRPDRARGRRILADLPRLRAKQKTPAICKLLAEKHVSPEITGSR